MSFTITNGITLPAWDAVLVQGDGTPADVTGAIVKFLMRSGDALLIDREAEVRDAANGRVWFMFQRDDALPGIYRAEFEVLYPDGNVGYYPGDGHILIQIAQNNRG